MRRFLGRDIDAVAPSPVALNQSLNFDTPCVCCGKNISELLSLAYMAPDSWPHEREQRANQFFLDSDDDILTEDLCRIGNDFFVRAIMSFPIVNSDQALLFGVWGSLSKENFQTYLETFDTGEQGQLDLMFSWLGNYGFCETETPVPCVLQPRNDRQRPVMVVAQEDHPLFAKQSDGLDWQEVERFLKNAGHLPAIDTMSP